MTAGAVSTSGTESLARILGDDDVRDSQRAWSSRLRLVDAPSISLTPNWLSSEVASLAPLAGTPMLSMRLVAQKPDGTAVTELLVRFRRRIVGHGVAELWGSDEHGVLKVHLVLHETERTLKLGLQYGGHANAAPGALLPGARLVRALEPPNELALFIVGTRERRVGSPISIPSPVEQLSGDFVPMLEMLDRVQRRTGTSFPVPDELSVRDLRELERADKLLAGETVNDTWRAAELTFDPEAGEWLRNLAEDNGQFLFENTGALTVIISQYELLVGEMVQRIKPVVFDDLPGVLRAHDADPSAPIVVRIHAANGTGDVQLRLTNRPAFDPFDDTDRERIHVSARDREESHRTSSRLHELLSPSQIA